MRVGFSFFVSNFLQPRRLFYLVNYFGVLCGLAFMVGALGGLVRFESGIPTSMGDVVDLVQKEVAPHLEGFVILIIVGVVWLFSADVCRGIFSRSCMYTTPVSKYQWLQWNAWLLALNLVSAVVLLFLNLSLFALPVLLGAMLTIGEAMNQSKQQGYNLIVFFLLALVLPYLSAAALSMPVVTIALSSGTCLLIPYAFAETSLRKWRTGFAVEQNETAFFSNIKLDGMNPNWSRLDKKKRSVEFPNSSNSYTQTVRNMLFPFSASMSWNSHAILKMMGMRVFIGSVMIAVMLAMSGSEMPFKGPFFLYTFMSVMFVATCLPGSRSLVIKYQILGRRESAKVLSSVCWKMGWLHAFSMLILLGVYEFLACSFFERAFSSGSMWSIMLNVLMLLVTTPLALAFSLDKSPRFGRLMKIKSVSVMVGYFLVLTFFSIWNETRISAVFNAAIAGQILIGLAVFSAASLYLINKYMSSYFSKNHLISR